MLLLGKGMLPRQVMLGLYVKLRRKNVQKTKVD